jgi:hypothetical protein
MIHGYKYKSNQIKQSGVTKHCHHHSNDTRTVPVRGKDTAKSTSVLDYNQYKGRLDLKDQPLSNYLPEKTWITNGFTGF